MIQHHKEKSHCCKIPLFYMIFIFALICATASSWIQNLTKLSVERKVWTSLNRTCKKIKTREITRKLVIPELKCQWKLSLLQHSNMKTFFTDFINKSFTPVTNTQAVQNSINNNFYHSSLVQKIQTNIKE